jgi:hypothetical protein
MANLRVIILENGTYCKEINPFGEKAHQHDPLSAEDYGMNLYLKERWQAAEQALRTFEIVDIDLPFGDGKEYDEFDIKIAIINLIPGSIHSAIELGDGKVKIIQ